MDIDKAENLDDLEIPSERIDCSVDESDFKTTTYSDDGFEEENLEKQLKINFLTKLTESWLKFEEKKKKDRRIIGYGLLGLIIAQITGLFFITYFSGAEKFIISDVKFSILITGMFAEIVGLFYIVVKNMFKDDGDQTLSSIIDLIKHKAGE